MSRRQRRWHLFVWVALAVAVPAVFAAALDARSRAIAVANMEGGR